MTLQQQFESGLSHHQAGRLAKAQRIYRQVLAQQPDHADALHLLGVLAAQAGRLDAAIDLIRKAIVICPTNPPFYNSLGNALKAGGRLDEAIASYRQAILLRPDLAGAHGNLANALRDKGQLDEAIACYRQAIRLKPDFADAHNSLGIALRAKGQLDEAIASYRLAVRLKPDRAEAHSNLGNALKDKGQLDEAIASYRLAIHVNPDYAEGHANLGNALKDKGQIDEAIAACQQAVRLKPDLAEAHSNLGNALQAKGQLDEAIASFRQAIRLNPDLAEATHHNLGNALTDKGQFDEAIAAYRRAIRIRPDYAEAHNNLGNALKATGQLDDAIASFRQAIRIKPDLVEAHSNLGNALKDIGQLDEAVASYRQAMQLRPDYELAHSNLLYTLHFHPDYDAGMIFQEHRRWNQRHAEPLRKFIQPHANNRDPDRQLRIGYISPDLCEHPVGRFLLPLLAAHDPDRFAVFCYSDVQRPDRYTGLLRRHAHQWRDTFGLTAEQAAELIRQDQIDILVDLTMHMAKNRLLVFARKPAPVQATYLAYCSTTGLDAMDYRLTDPHLDPLGMNDAFYREKSIRLPETYWCYPLDEQRPQVSPPPALSSGEVTFGCLNNFCKVSPGALDLWTQLLRATPKSHLILFASAGSHRQRVRDLLEHQGIDPRRLNFVDSVPLPQYFSRYHQIDIGLDPFPCNGGTTTCDALWMGVPVITLMGRTAVGRGGGSVLRNVGLPELVAETPAQYVQIATDLAGDLSRLAELRRTLRPRMLASPLMDGPRFARNIEAAYRQMWGNWCTSQQGG
ncbi:MAG: tetratricopeptide repeat protein [Tepidisphaeraceae bacterium]|jgi:predicted O-linked N-acetylglucosamine transferase (SPINDLY family)